jgi:hypothetical protein
MTAIVNREHANATWLTGTAGLLILTAAFAMMACAAPSLVHARPHDTLTQVARVYTCPPITRKLFREPEVGRCPHRCGGRVPKKFMYPQQTDADGPAHPSPVRPIYTTAVAGSQLLVVPSTFTVTGSPVGEPRMPHRTASPLIGDHLVRHRDTGLAAQHSRQPVAQHGRIRAARLSQNHQMHRSSSFHRATRAGAG